MKKNAAPTLAGAAIQIYPSCVCGDFLAIPLLPLYPITMAWASILDCYQPPPPVGGGLLCVPRPMRSPPFINVIGFKSLTLIFFLLQCRFLQSLRPLQTKFQETSCMLSLLLRILLIFHANYQYQIPPRHSWD